MNCNETNIAPEVLAPAGGPESLQAAVRAGADAVYLGASAFSARANVSSCSSVGEVFPLSMLLKVDLLSPHSADNFDIVNFRKTRISHK